MAGRRRREIAGCGLRRRPMLRGRLQHGAADRRRGAACRTAKTPSGRTVPTARVARQGQDRPRRRRCANDVGREAARQREGRRSATLGRIGGRRPKRALPRGRRARRTSRRRAAGRPLGTSAQPVGEASGEMRSGPWLRGAALTRLSTKRVAPSSCGPAPVEERGDRQPRGRANRRRRRTRGMRSAVDATRRAEALARGRRRADSARRVAEPSAPQLGRVARSCSTRWQRGSPRAAWRSAIEQLRRATPGG